jgi:acetyl CoA:N6-hydroxylysine acetyl transferase
VATLTPREFRATLDDDSCSGQFLLRRMDPDRDLNLVHSWMNDAEVARFWEMPWPRERIASYLLEQHRSVDSAAYLGEWTASR